MPVNASEREDEYFARQEFEQLKKLGEKNRLKMEAVEKQRLKDLHYMSCPKCGIKLIAVHFNGVEVDKCPGCEGVWLDAGELEAISKFNNGGLNKWFNTFKR